MPFETQYLFCKSDRESESGTTFYLVTGENQNYQPDGCVNMGEIEVQFEIPENITSDEIRRRSIETFKQKNINPGRMITHVPHGSETTVGGGDFDFDEGTPFQ